MKIKITGETTVDYRISKDFTIELEDGTELYFNKYISDSDMETDSDYEFTKESKEIFDKLPEEQQDDIIDFINEIKL